MAKLNRTYQYKDTSYIVTQVGLRVKVNGEWKDAVGYTEYSNLEELLETKYIREQSEFDTLFIPTMLEVGDYIVGYSMGRPRSKWQVTELQTDNETEEEYAVAVNQANKAETMTFKLEISSTAAISPYDPSTEQATDYYYQMENIDEVVRNVPTINEISSMLADGAERVKNISENVPSFQLEEARESVKQTLQVIYNRFDV